MAKQPPNFPFPKDVEEKMGAAVGLIGRTGAENFQLRYQDDEEPTVWVAVATYKKGAEAAASLDPVRAILRLAEELVDGGMCAHCKKPSGLDADSLEAMPMDDVICWYQYDPELKTFRRGCE